MLRRPKRVTYNRRNSPRWIAEFLRVINAKTYSKKLVRVLDCINEINTNIDDWRVEKKYGLRGEVISARINTSRLSELHDEINSILCRIRLVPNLRNILGWKGGNAYIGTESGREDSILVRTLLDAAASGLLDRVQKCPCGIWFHRRVKLQRFHTAQCREKAFKSTEKWKAYRRQKAREYYELHKNKNIK